MTSAFLTLIAALSLIAAGTPYNPRGPGAYARPLATTPVYEPVQDERGLAALDQALREITNPFTVLCLAARPGDEDGAVLAYVRKKLGARAVILFGTRGEGEESQTRSELGRDLSAVRTRESIEAARIISADLFFLNLRDIGYSKSADEALSEWGHDEALRRMVRAIRLLRPDVIITNHNPKAGEGVEQAVTRLALEAFAAAADTKLASEAGSEPWQPRRFFCRTDEPTADVAINLNEYDQVRGLSYARIGLAAHQRFISRGCGLDRLTPERDKSYYKLITSSPVEKLKQGSGLLDDLSLPENVSRSIVQPRVGDQGVVDAIAARERLIDALIEKLIEKRAEGTPSTMRERYGAEFVRVVRFTIAIERALALALGLNLEITLYDRVVVPGQKLVLRCVLRNGGRRSFPVVFSAPERLPVPEKDSAYQHSDEIGVGTAGVAIREFEYEIPTDSALTLPHSEHLYDEEYYAIGTSLPGTHPAEPFGNRAIVTAEVGLGQASIRLASVSRFDVAPSVEISTIPFAMIKDWATPRDIEFTVRARNRTPGSLAGAFWVVPLAMTEDDYQPLHIAFARENDEVTIKLKLRLPILKPPLASDVLIEFRKEKPAPADPLGSAKIPVKALGVEMVDAVNVGYIPAVGEWLSFALRQLGVAHSEIKPGEISSIEHGSSGVATQSRRACGDLSRFDTIIIDGNAYATRPELLAHNRCLLRYARQGGNLILLGQRADDWNLILTNTQFAPYPIKLSKYRITLENAAVKILHSEHPLMSRPNQITSKDFEGWSVDRASNVPSAWSAEYVPLLESSEPAEEPSRGGLLVANYGEGTYVYASYTWRRQLMSANAGAFRLFANLVSLPKTAKAPKPQ